MYIVLQGIVSETTLAMLSNKLHFEVKKEGAIFLFCDYSKFQVPLGTVFNYIVDGRSKVSAFKARMELIYVTQEFFQPYEFIPIGHKTICQFNFTQRAFNFLSQELPIIDSWKPLSFSFYLSTDEKEIFGS